MLNKSEHEFKCMAWSLCINITLILNICISKYVLYIETILQAVFLKLDQGWFILEINYLHCYLIWTQFGLEYLVLFHLKTIHKQKLKPNKRVTAFMTASWFSPDEKYPRDIFLKYRFISNL